jgi:SAM-dependent methyltransferase
VLSIGSRDDADGEGGRYRDYFSLASSYTTSDIAGPVDCALDVRDMASIADSRFSGIFCSGVLEHVDDFHRALAEITRILAPGGTLLLGVPMRQAIHDAPGDFWRFTRFAIDYLLADRYSVLEIKEIDRDPAGDFPAAYWVRAVKKVSASPAVGR